MNHPKKQKGIILTSQVRKVSFRQVTWLFMSQSYQGAEPGFKARSDDSTLVLLRLRQCPLQIGICHWHLPSTSITIKSCAVSAADLQHPLKGVQGGEQKWGTVLREKLAELSLQLVRYFHELILWAQFLFLFISRKTLKSSMWTTIAHD